jgi:TPP-dependent pyruvate/acetoin dehydrogenase alpha subunit
MANRCHAAPFVKHGREAHYRSHIEMISTILKSKTAGVTAAVILATIGASITGCSQSKQNSVDMKDAFKKTAPPSGYTEWQKKMAAGGGAPGAPAAP